MHMMHTNETYTIPVSMTCISYPSAAYRLSRIRTGIQLQNDEAVRAPGAPDERQTHGFTRYPSEKHNADIRTESMLKKSIKKQRYFSERS